MKNPAIASLLMGALMISLAQAQEWPQWRGPNLNGSSPAKGLPEKLTEANTAWQTELPGPGSGTPIIWQDRIFVSSLDASRKLVAMCLSRSSGKVLWSHPVAEGFAHNGRNDTASPSAVTDGKSVWFYFGTGDLVAYDMDGNQKWARNIQTDFGKFNILWIYASSPLLYDGKLYVQVLQRDVPLEGPASGPPADSYLLAMDPATGKTLWRQVRPNDALAESKESYGTPIGYEKNGHKEILLIGGDCVTAHDPDTGKELWRCGGYNTRKNNSWRVVSSLVAGDGLVVGCPPKGGAVFAIKDGGSGDVTQTHIAWKNPKLTSDVCAPLFYKDHFYVLNGDRKELFCAAAKTGEILWSVSMGGHSVFRGSPTGADGKIYCINEAGDVWVLSADEAKILSTARLGGNRTHASIAVVDGLVVIRAGDKIFAFK